MEFSPFPRALITPQSVPDPSRPPQRKQARVEHAAGSRAQNLPSCIGSLLVGAPGGTESETFSSPPFLAGKLRRLRDGVCARVWGCRDGGATGGARPGGCPRGRCPLLRTVQRIKCNPQSNMQAVKPPAWSRPPVSTTSLWTSRCPAPFKLPGRAVVRPGQCPDPRSPPLPVPFSTPAPRRRTAAPERRRRSPRR